MAEELLINHATSMSAAAFGFPLGRTVETVAGEHFVATRYEPVKRVAGFGGAPGVAIYGYKVEPTPGVPVIKGRDLANLSSWDDDSSEDEDPLPPAGGLYLRCP